uniref:Putative ixodes 10 kDa peptide protein n=1 Tax=Ixodes ricinus TaxID=34613 RepID=A0A0K8R715_IXORI
MEPLMLLAMFAQVFGSFLFSFIPSLLPCFRDTDSTLVGHVTNSSGSSLSKVSHGEITVFAIPAGRTANQILKPICSSKAGRI